MLFAAFQCGLDDPTIQEKRLVQSWPFVSEQPCGLDVSLHAHAPSVVFDFADPVGACRDNLGGPLGRQNSNAVSIAPTNRAETQKKGRIGAARREV